MRRYTSLLAVPLLFTAALSFSKVIDKPQAVVNGEPILESEFKSTIAPVLEQWKRATPMEDQTPEKLAEFKKGLLDMMVDNKVLKQEAVKRKIKVPKREIDEYIKQFKAGYKTEGEFQDELKRENMTQAQFEKKVEEEMMAMKLAKQEISDSLQMPSDEQAKKLYDQIQAKLEGKPLGLSEKEEKEIDQLARIMKQMSSELVKVRHILVQAAKDASMQDKLAAQKQIDKVSAELKKKGADFEEVAKKYSDDAYSRENGGLLGYITKDDERYPKEFVKEALSLNVGQVSKPVLTEFGWHVIKADEKKAARKVPYEEVSNDLKGILYKKEQQKKYEDWVKSLKAKASIKLNPIE